MRERAEATEPRVCPQCKMKLWPRAKSRALEPEDHRGDLRAFRARLFARRSEPSALRRRLPRADCEIFAAPTFAEKVHARCGQFSTQSCAAGIPESVANQIWRSWKCLPEVSSGYSRKPSRRTSISLSRKSQIWRIEPEPSKMRPSPRMPRCQSLLKHRQRLRTEPPARCPERAAP